MLYLSFSKMKKTNPIERTQRLENDLEYERKKRKVAEKENRELRKEVEELKKNLDGMKTRTPLLL